jgi:hypothetical protein
VFDPQNHVHTHTHAHAKYKIGRGVTQVVEHLPSKCTSLSSNPSTVKKKKSSGYADRVYMKHK